MRNRFVACLGLLLAGLAAGCTEKTVTEVAGSAASGERSFQVVVAGRIVDAETRAGVAGATVGFQDAGTDVRASTVAGDVGNFPAGIFEVRGIFPTEPRVHRLRVTHPDYAPKEFCVFVPATATAGVGASQLHTVDVGVLEVGREVRLPVLVRLNGTPEPAARLFAFDPLRTNAPIIVDPADTVAFAAYKAATGSLGTSAVEDTKVPEILAETDGAGNAVIDGLDRTVAYSIVVAPRDRDADGRLDYAATVGSVAVAAGALAQPLVIDLTATPPQGRIDPPVPQDLVGLPNPVLVETGPIVATATAFLKDNSVTATAQGDGAEVMSVRLGMTGDRVTLLFKQPVQIVPPGSGTGSPAFFWVDNLVDPKTVTTLTFPDFKRVDATITSLAGGTVWQFAPSAALTENEDVTLDFEARLPSSSNANAAFFGSVECYRPKLQGGLAATTTPTADNYNGRAQDPSAGAAATVYLEFPEVVFGFYQLLEFTEGTLTTRLGGFPIRQLDGSSGEGELVFTDGKVNTVGGAQDNPDGASTGVGAGVFYRVPVISFDGQPLRLADHASAGGSGTHRIRVQVSADDVEGNRVEGIFDLDVQ